jgi:redox-sensitive bicupin YhaK (pirin superfamily)
MIQLRRAPERGHLNFGWLDTYHTFSFGEYHDPRYMGFRSLRVINEDLVSPGSGFPTHPHRDMEILTYILEGSLEHKDSMGNGAVIRPGEVQRMTAGTGVTHSEFNPSKTDPVRLLQIWILPDKKGLKPGYEQTSFLEAMKTGKPVLVASPDGAEGSVTLHQDARVWAAKLKRGQKHSRSLEGGRHGWIQVARGSLKLNAIPLQTSDAAAVTDVPRIDLEAAEDCEFLLFDLA